MSFVRAIVRMSWFVPRLFLFHATVRTVIVATMVVRRSKRPGKLRRSARQRARMDQDAKIYGQDFGILPSD